MFVFVAALSFHYVYVSKQPTAVRIITIIFYIIGNKLYWIDGKTMKIESAQLDGSGRTTLLHETSAHYFGIALYSNQLYFTDWNRR